jgi:hypothetical protein
MEVNGQLHHPVSHLIGGWVGFRSGLDTVEKRKSCPCTVSNPGHLFRSPSTELRSSIQSGRWTAALFTVNGLLLWIQIVGMLGMEVECSYIRYSYRSFRRKRVLPFEWLCPHNLQNNKTATAADIRMRRYNNVLRNRWDDVIALLSSVFLRKSQCLQADLTHRRRGSQEPPVLAASCGRVTAPVDSSRLLWFLRDSFQLISLGKWSSLNMKFS